MIFLIWTQLNTFSTWGICIINDHQSAVENAIVGFSGGNDGWMLRVVRFELKL